jgi:hypothetical protein
LLLFQKGVQAGFIKIANKPSDGQHPPPSQFCNINYFHVTSPLVETITQEWQQQQRKGVLFGVHRQSKGVVLHSSSKAKMVS